MTDARPKLAVLLALGIAGGILPDPAALALLLGALSSGKIMLGLVTVVVFSLGFASTLVVVGVIAAKVGQKILDWLSSIWAVRLQVATTLLMLAIQVVQQIQRDARMREAADQIHKEVGILMADIGRLADRVRKLQTHSNQANEDIRQILVSTEKIERRGDRIRQVEFDEADGAGANGTSEGAARAEANVIQAPLRLHVTE